ncbi:MAG: S-layer homology domain-containing protein [Dehalobacterium sp.]
MKKLVVFLVMAMMMFCLVGTAFAADFADVKDLDQDAQASIAKLNILKVIEGYPDGTFKPENTITRAEFAKIAIVLGGLEKSADVLKGSPTKFKDVAAGQWYTGWINLAESQGYVKGFPDGTFRPNAQITYAEVVTVLLRVLGYNDNLPGPWPVDYIAKAGALDITEDVAFTANANATRVDVAVMADVTLDCNVVKWDADDQDFVDKNGSGNETTLMKQSFDTAINEDYLISETNYDDGVWSIKVAATDDNEKALDKKVLDLSADCVISDGSLPTGLNNAMVNILYNDDTEEVLFLEITSAKVTVDGEDWKVTKTQTINGSAYPSQYEIDGIKYDVADWADKDDLLLAANISDDAVYRAFINEDKDVYLVTERPAETPAVVEAYEDGELSVKVEGTYPLDDVVDVADIDFEDDSVLIEKDGAFVGPDNLEENDVIYVDEDSFGYDYYISVAGSISETGTYSGYKAETNGGFDQIRIDGSWYDVADENALSDDDGNDFDKVINSSNLEDSDDAAITYFLNKANQVCFVVLGEIGSGVSSKTYGVVTDLSYNITKDGNMVSGITVLKKDGTETKYGIDTSEVELYMDGGSKTDVLEEDDFIKFTVDGDNVIDSLTILAQTTGGEGTAEVVKTAATISGDYRDSANEKYVGVISDGDDDNNRIKFAGKWYTVNDSTTVLNGGTFRDDDAEAVSIADLIDWATEKPNATAYVQYDGTKVEYIYVNNNVASSIGGDYAAVLSFLTKKGDPWAEVDIKGTATEYEIKSGAAIAKVGVIYDYSLSSGKVNLEAIAFDPYAGDKFIEGESIYKPSTADSYYVYKVEEVDKSGNAVCVGDTWLYAGDDTMIYNYDDSEDDVEYLANVKSITKNDYIVYFGDEKELDLLIVVSDIK